jgi:hypothetical protein
VGVEAGHRDPTGLQEGAMPVRSPSIRRDGNIYRLAGNHAEIESCLASHKEVLATGRCPPRPITPFDLAIDKRNRTAAFAFSGRTRTYNPSVNS